MMSPSTRPVDRIDVSMDLVNVPDPQRAIRLRNNKRRHRQRQADYISSLETQLKEYQSQGVKVTQQVQLSARKVVEDNKRLKALLRHVGVTDDVIETWTPNVLERTPKSLGSEEKLPGILERNNPKIVMKFGLLSTTSIQVMETASSHLESTAKLSASNNNELHGQKESTPPNEQFIASLPITAPLAPCKVLSRLAVDPGADVTQPNMEGEISDDQENGGVECSKAHNMLMRFAISEEKLDVISQALEHGCVKNVTGGCKVRNEAIWKAIDDVT